MKKFFAKLYKGHVVPVVASVFTVVMVAASNAYAIGVDLLAGVTWSALTDDLVATILPVVTAGLAVLALIMGIRLAVKTLRTMAR